MHVEESSVVLLITPCRCRQNAKPSMHIDCRARTLQADNAFVKNALQHHIGSIMTGSLVGGIALQILLNHRCAASYALC